MRRRPKELALAGVLLWLGGGCALIGIDAWHGEVEAGGTGRYAWVDPRALVFAGTGFVVSAVALLARWTLSRSVDWWPTGTKLVVLGSMLVTIAFALLSPRSEQNGVTVARFMVGLAMIVGGLLAWWSYRHRRRYESSSRSQRDETG